jgi:hypothetical protein
MKRISRVKPVKPKRSIKDIRLWLGFIFVLTAVLLTQNLLAKATSRTQAVIIQNEIPAGSPIRSSDLAVVNVVLPEGVKTISALSQADGMNATRDLFIGDILTIDSMSDGADKSLRLVSVPIRAGHLPNLDIGQLVDVWMTPSIDGMALPGPAQLLISQATISMIPDGIDPTIDTAVTLLIPSNQVQVLVQAMRDGVIDIVALPENRRTKS